MAEFLKYGTDEAGNRVGLTADGQTVIIPTEASAYTKTGTDEAGNRVGLTADGRTEIIPQQQQPTAPPASIGEDVAKSAAIGLPKGAVGLVGLPGSILQGGAAFKKQKEAEMSAAAQANPNSSAVVFDAMNKRPSILNVLDAGMSKASEYIPSGSDIQGGIEKITGPWFQPKTGPGRVAEFTTSLAAGMGKPSLDKMAQMLAMGGAGGGAGEAMTAAGVENPWLKGGAQMLATLLGAKGYNVGKSFVEPTTAAGQQNITARHLLKVAGDDAPGAINKMKTAQELVPGSKPTVGQVSGNAGLATAERTAFSASPNVAQDVKLSQNAARVKALGFSGDDATLEAAKKSRTDKTTLLYKAVDNSSAHVDTAKIDSLIDGVIVKNQGNAKLVKALDDAKKGLYSGDKLATNPQHVKSAIDNIKTLISDGNKENYAVSQLITIKDALSRKLGNAVPEYKQAEELFSQLSKPINQQEIGQELIKRASSSQLDLMHNPDLLPGKFGNIVKGGDDLAKSATGFKRAKLDRSLTQEQLQSIQAVNADLARVLNADKAGRIGGSDTYQKALFAGKANESGIPIQAFASPSVNPITNWALKNLNRNTGEEIAATQARMMADPKLTAQLMEKALSAKQPFMPVNVGAQVTRVNEGEERKRRALAEALNPKQAQRR